VISIVFLNSFKTATVFASFFGEVLYHPANFLKRTVNNFYFANDF